MAPSAADLQDPPKTDQASAHSSSGQTSTDEMLAQLAGNEIDRLLTEAGNEKISEAAAESKVVAEETARDEVSLNKQLDTLFKDLQAEVDEIPVTPAASPPDPAPPAAEPVAKSDVEAAADSAAAPETAPVAKDSTAAPEGAEKNALLEAAGFDASAPKPPAAEPPTAESERDAVLSAAGFEMDGNSESSQGGYHETPVYLKPLEWINSPLKSFPVSVRQALGRAAILTLVNAILVMGYVRYFRKH